MLPYLYANRALRCLCWQARFLGPYCHIDVVDYVKMNEYRVRSRHRATFVLYRTLTLDAELLR